MSERKPGGAAVLYGYRKNAIAAARRALGDPAARAGVDFTIAEVFGEAGAKFTYQLTAPAVEVPVTEAPALPVVGGGIDAFALAVALEMARRRPRPFAAFRGDLRRPVKRRAASGQADYRRVVVMSLPPDRSSNISKLQRGLRIIERLKAAQ